MESLHREFLRIIFVLAQIDSNVISGHPSGPRAYILPKKESSRQREEKSKKKNNYEKKKKRCIFNY